MYLNTQNTHMYMVQMILHKTKGGASMLTKQALFTTEKYSIFIWNKK